jgi:hypothetical protein
MSSSESFTEPPRTTADPENLRTMVKEYITDMLSDRWLVMGVILFIGSFILTTVIATRNSSPVTGAIGVLNIAAYICISVSVRNDKRKKLQHILATKVPERNISVDFFPAISRDATAQQEVNQFINDSLLGLRNTMERITEQYQRLVLFIQQLPTARHIPHGEELETLLTIRSSVRTGITHFYTQKDQLQLFFNAFKIDMAPYTIRN